MKLSKSTLDVLKNFSTVNQNILILPGNQLTTRAVAKNMYVAATVQDEFDSELGIYNLSEFLGIVSLFSEPEFDVSSTQIIISQGKNKVIYGLAEKSVIDYPDKPIKMPAADAQFELSEEDLKSLIKAGSILSCTDLMIEGDGENIYCAVTDPKNPSSNTFSIKVGTTSSKFKSYIKLENLKMPIGMYEVSISSKKISQFSSKTSTYSMYIACEKTSTAWE